MPKRNEPAPQGNRPTLRTTTTAIDTSDSSRSRRRAALAHDIPVIDAEVVDPIGKFSAQCSCGWRGRSHLHKFSAMADATEHADAKRLDRRIRLLVQTIADNWTKLYELVDQAKRGGEPQRAAHLRKIFYAQLALKSAQSRRRRNCGEA